MKEGKSADNHHRTQRIFLFKLNFEFPVCFFISHGIMNEI